MDKKVFDYVKKYFKTRFPEKCLMLENEEINNIVIEVCKELKAYNRNLVLESRVDEVIFELLNGFVKKYRSKMWTDTINLENYVSEYIDKNFSSNRSSEINNYIIKQIVVELIPHYNLSKMKKGLFDNNIQLLYKEQVNKLYTKVYDEIYRKIANMEIAFMPGFNNDKICSHLVRQIMEDGEFTILDDLHGKKYDDYIFRTIKRHLIAIEQRNREERNLKNNENLEINTIQYIYNVLFLRVDNEHNLSNEHMEECIKYIDERLRLPSKSRDRGLTPEEIISHKYDSEIVRYYNRYVMKMNSTASKQKPKKVKHQPKLRWIQKHLSVLLITATLIGIAGTGVYGVGKLVDGFADGVIAAVDDITNIKYDKVIDEFDNYEYSYIFSKDNDSVKPTAKNAVHFYEKVKDYNNENYYYLGFYRAYQNVRDHRLQIMDKMLGIVQLEVSQRNDRDSFYNSVAMSSCYLEFAMDRLYEMGFEEIKEDKYQKALNAYIDAKYTNFGSDPMNYVSDSNRKVIYEIMEKYQQYSDQILVELGVAVHADKDNSTNLTSLSGRGM